MNRPAMQAPSFASLFDQVELLGTNVPFIDPFSYVDRDFRDSGFSSSEGHAQTRNTEAQLNKRKAEKMGPSSEEVDCLSRLGRRMPMHSVYATPQFAYTQLPESFESTYPRQVTQSLRPHLPVLLAQDPSPLRTPAIELNASSVLRPVPYLPTTGPPTYPESGTGSVTERIRLTPDQAIHIFLLGRTKTAGTAAELARKYGISAKAIRDIWTKKSWAQDTRLHWTD